MHLYLQLWIYGGIIAYFFIKADNYIDDYKYNWGFDNWADFFGVLTISFILSWINVLYLIIELILETFDFTKPPKWL